METLQTICWNKSYPARTCSKHSLIPAQFKKVNREEATQLQLLTASDKPWEHLGNLATNIAQIASLPDDRLEDVQAKEQKYAELVRSTGYEFGRQLADA